MKRPGLVNFCIVIVINSIADLDGRPDGRLGMGSALVPAGNETSTPRAVPWSTTTTPVVGEAHHPQLRHLVGRLAQNDEGDYIGGEYNGYTTVGDRERGPIAAEKVNLTVVVGPTPDVAVVSWWPEHALDGRQVEVVYQPQHANYKVMIEAPEPLQNTLDLIDLIPEAFYQLEIRETSDSGNVQILARVTFSTSVIDASEVYLSHQLRKRRKIRVRPEEVFVVCIVLCIWSFAIYIFFNQWAGKIRGIIPYQPQYQKYPESPDEEAELMTNNGQVSLTDRRAMTFDEILTGHNYSRQRKYVGPYCSIYIAGHHHPAGSLTMRDYNDVEGSHLLSSRRNRSASQIVRPSNYYCGSSWHSPQGGGGGIGSCGSHKLSSPNNALHAAAWAATSAIRKAKSAEILFKPKIVVENGSILDGTRTPLLQPRVAATMNNHQQVSLDIPGAPIDRSFTSSRQSSPASFNRSSIDINHGGLVTSLDSANVVVGGQARSEQTNSNCDQSLLMSFDTPPPQQLGRRISTLASPPPPPNERLSECSVGMSKRHMLHHAATLDVSAAASADPFLSLRQQSRVSTSNPGPVGAMPLDVQNIVMTRKAIEHSRRAFLKAVRGSDPEYPVMEPAPTRGPSPFNSLNMSPNHCIAGSTSPHPGPPAMMPPARLGWRRAKMSSLENSIPMTTTLMNRMNKRKDAAAVPKYYIKHQRLSDPDHNNPARKGANFEGDPIHGGHLIHHPVYHAAPPSFTAMPILTLPAPVPGPVVGGSGLPAPGYSPAAMTRVGSFRSRLKKQGHITDPPPAIEVSVPVQVEREISQERERANSAGSNGPPGLKSPPPPPHEEPKRKNATSTGTAYWNSQSSSSQSKGSRTSKDEESARYLSPVYKAQE